MSNEFPTEAQLEALRLGRQGESGYTTHEETPRERETKRLKAIRARMTPEQWKMYITAYRKKKKAKAKAARAYRNRELEELRRKEEEEARKKPKPQIIAHSGRKLED